jgi:hypothetical protein
LVCTGETGGGDAVGVTTGAADDFFGVGFAGCEAGGEDAGAVGGGAEVGGGAGADDEGGGAAASITIEPDACPPGPVAVTGCVVPASVA